jgi:hypothetical protein
MRDIRERHVELGGAALQPRQPAHLAVGLQTARVQAAEVRQLLALAQKPERKSKRTSNARATE